MFKFIDLQQLPFSIIYYLLFGGKMNLYKIADLYVELACEKITTHNAKKYLTDDKNVFVPAISIHTDMKQLKRQGESLNYSDDILAYLYEGNEFARQILKFDGIRLHSSAVVVNGNAYLFSAPCGTGKSTHTSKWLDLFGDKAFIINDDKPIMRIINKEFYIYGSPWSGKHDISVNTSAKLKGICFLKRDNRNWIKSMDSKEAIKQILFSTRYKCSSEQMLKKLEIIDKIIANIPIYEMGCTPTIEAAQMAYDYMSK